MASGNLRKRAAHLKALKSQKNSRKRHPKRRNEAGRKNPKYKIKKRMMTMMKKRKTKKKKMKKREKKRKK